MKLSTYAKKLGIVYRTAHIHFKNGAIPGAYQLPTGTIIVPDDVQSKADYTVIYARVSSSENKSNLETQADRLSQFCTCNGWIVQEVVKECASGLNDARPKLCKVLQDRKATRLVVEHKDRLTRFGFNYIKILYPECDIVVVNEVGDSEKDLMQDFVSLVTSFCARLYGKRRTQHATEKIIKAVQE